MHAALGLAHVDRGIGDGADPLAAGMRHPGQHVAGLDVGVGHHVRHRVDGAEGHLAAQQLDQFRLAVPAGPVGDDGDHFVAVGRTAGVFQEPRVGAQFRPAHGLGQGAPEVIGRTGDRDPAVAGRKHPERAQQGMGVAFGPRHLAGVGMLVDHPLAQGKDGVVHRDVDELAFAGALGVAHRRQDADGQQHRRHDVADPGADLQRVLAVRAGDAHDPAHRLRHDVEGRPVGIGTGARTRIAEAAHGGIDQAGVELGQALVGQTQALHRAGAEILHQHIGLLDQAADDGLAGRGLEVDGNALLVAVDALVVTAEVTCLVVGKVRRRAAGHVAPGRLHLDHLGALVGKQHGAEGSGQHLRQVDHPQSGQRAPALGAQLSAQWLRRLISTRRSPSKTTLSSWLRPQWWKVTTPASSRSPSSTARTWL